MNLLLDLGNTRLKWTLAEGVRVRGAVGALAWDTPDFETRLDAALAALPPPRAVHMAVVAAAAREARVLACVRRVLRIEPRAQHSVAALCGVHSAYREPARLGIDRLLGMVAARGAGHAPCVLASLGTALTLDALDAEGRHRGGLIVAAPALMQQALLGAAARVSVQGEGRVTWLADNTEDALISGAWLAAAALVERFSEESAQALDAQPRLLLAGGDAPRLQALLRGASQLFPDAVLRGLAIAADAQHEAD
ncbi:MAG: type III pantothenate kinase [Metallibacterium scheffleri]|uniref:type III pantothenate kinase n=1 Tax=Metallibacterium scheffleri TaxID=993689 RepID=UPI0026EB1724|nr:type III pantothenate kinase [Metallibacterium scheffleri]MCK9366258.1 type III pantothenate kinase [Metallibacterium scheffleri]